MTVAVQALASSSPVCISHAGGCTKPQRASPLTFCSRADKAPSSVALAGFGLNRTIATGAKASSRSRSVTVRAEMGAPGDILPPEYTDLGKPESKGRRAGILIHPTSLPGEYGCGEIGQEAFRFIDWLVEAGMQIWQVLPLVPPDEEYWSPYSGKDANCGNVLLISLEGLVEDGLLEESELPAKVGVEDADFNAVRKAKEPLLKLAAERLLASPKAAELRREMAAFQADELVSKWLPDASLFSAINNNLVKEDPSYATKAWWDWPQALKFRDADALAKEAEAHADFVNEFEALQFLFDRQWGKLKAYAGKKGVSIIGDMPIYVGGHSADVWAHRDLFELDADGYPQQVSGVPPDAFSDDGQLWGSPLYDWKAHAAEDYAWWSVRLGRANVLYDETRIDHFRALAGYWSIDATSETAKNGVWKVGPGEGFFTTTRANIGGFEMIAEDLGVITPDVVALREAIDAPGMLVLQFAWGGGGTNVHLPHNHYENAVVYPGTHDNETTVGWFNNPATPAEAVDTVKAYFGVDGSDIAWDFIRVGMASVSKTCIISMQDVLSLDNTARMNTPGKAAGNWGWRIGDSGVWESLAEQAADLKMYTEMYDRPFPKVEVAAGEEEEAGAEEGNGAAGNGSGKGFLEKLKSLLPL